MLPCVWGPVRQTFHRCKRHVTNERRKIHLKYVWSRCYFLSVSSCRPVCYAGWMWRNKNSPAPVNSHASFPQEFYKPNVEILEQLLRQDYLQCMTDSRKNHRYILSSAATLETKEENRMNIWPKYDSVFSEKGQSQVLLIEGPGYNRSWLRIWVCNFPKTSDDFLLACQRAFSPGHCWKLRTASFYRSVTSAFSNALDFPPYARMT